LSGGSSIYHIAVTELAATVGRSGDLRRRDFSLLRGADGIRLHRKLQRSRPETYRAEVTIRTTWKELEIEGRIDGVDKGTVPVLEEIKTTRHPERDAAEPNSVHVLQVQLYGWMWQREYGEVPELRICYATPGGEVHPVSVPMHPDMEEQLEEALRLRNEREQWIRKRNRELRKLPFPFTGLRAGQAELMDAVETAFTDRDNLLVEAPTGIGKTLAVLVPALRALGEERVSTLFVATCRNTGKNTMEDAMRALLGPLTGLRALTLQAKDRVCRVAGSPCNCDECPLARGFYDRLPGALAALRNEKLWDVATWNRIAAEHRVCPFAFSMRAAREADVLIGDINYALDPSARLEFLFGSPGHQIGLLVDEAHHLPGRVRGMLSASLNPLVLRRLLLEAPSPHRNVLGKEINRVIREIRTYLQEAVEENGWPREEAAPPTRVGVACSRALEVLEHSLAEAPVREGDPRMTLFQTLAAFQSAMQHGADAHVAYRENGALHWFCRDPGPWVRDRLSELACTVLFSATLQPMDSFRRTLGLPSDTTERVLPCPFNPDHLQITVEASFSLAYRNRTEETFFRLSETLIRLLSESRKNTLVFFPSYSMMDQVAARMPPPDLVMGPIWVQPRGLQEEAAREFLEPFFQSGHAGSVFAVLGGALNEGIDLPGSALTRVIMVSIGLPLVCMEREILRDTFSRGGEDGFAMAYMLPGITRIRQAMGRVIRGPEDRGEVVLIDQRFDQPGYRNFLVR
jgi:DNA excision repair protein ERCC-2